MGNVLQTIQQHIPERCRRLRSRANRIGYDRPSGSTGYEQYPQDRYKITHASSGTQMEYDRSTQKYEADHRGTQTEPSGSKAHKPDYNSNATIAFGQTPNYPNRGNYAQGGYPHPGGYPQGGGYPQNTEYPTGGPYQRGYPQPSGQQGYPNQQQGGYGGYPPPQQGWGPPQQQGGYGGYPPQQGYGQQPNQMNNMANKAGMAACIACLTCLFCSCCQGLMGQGMPGEEGEGGGLDGSADVSSPADDG